VVPVSRATRSCPPGNVVIGAALALIGGIVGTHLRLVH
jgi:hypothetical protein